ncbi:unnamed protein product [Linum trigynum]|uniref:Uncharacterized protein n=1 Tax=Linum trigynum TaxID=586398 RepID=A0AAV2FWQ4_9ROSI
MPAQQARIMRSNLALTTLGLWIMRPPKDEVLCCGSDQHRVCAGPAPLQGIQDGEEPITLAEDFVDTILLLLGRGDTVNDDADTNDVDIRNQWMLIVTAEESLLD